MKTKGRQQEGKGKSDSGKAAARATDQADGSSAYRLGALKARTGLEHDEPIDNPRLTKGSAYGM
jgi:hypothetical protein